MGKRRLGRTGDGGSGMSTMTQPPALWNSMPGWGIVADLTPPELIASRRLRVLRKFLTAALVLVVALCLLGYGWATLQSRSASKALATEQARTTQLRNEESKYAGVTQIQAALAQTNTQVAKLLATDVDFANLVGSLRQNLPGGMTITQLTVALATGTTGATSSAGTSVLDTSGRRHVGTITITGTGIHMTDVSVFVDRLSTIKGVAVPYPSTNVQTPHGIQYTVQIILTEDVFSHRFDTSATGGK
jgi:hypothetical protein